MSIVNKRDHRGLPGQVLAEKIWQLNLIDEGWHGGAEETITFLKQRIEDINNALGSRLTYARSSVPIPVELARCQLRNVLAEIDDVLMAYLLAYGEDDWFLPSRVLSWLTCELIRAEWEVAYWESECPQRRKANDKAKAPNNRL